MAVELVTGYAGTAHVSSSEDGARQAGTVGTGMYVLETVDDSLKATLENANTVTVGPGDALINGRHVQLTGSTTFAIPVGTQGQRTSNLLVIRYEVAEDGTESATALTLTGSPSTAEPEDPELATGDILAGDSPVDMPLYRVVTTGIETAEPEALFQTIPPIASLPGVFGNVLDVAHGGTGQTSLQAARNAMGLGNTTGALPVANGGTGMTSSPSMLVNLSSTSAAGVFQSAPRPGVTGTLPVANGGTGATSGTSALNNLGIKSWLLANVFKVGFVWVSYTNTSPASILGGTWAPITGRFPYFNAGTGTGGNNSHTHGLGAGYAQFNMQSQSAEDASLIIGRRASSWSNGSGTLINFSSPNFNRIQDGSVSTQSRATQLGGSTDSGSNMPAYQTLYAWRRTA